MAEAGMAGAFVQANTEAKHLLVEHYPANLLFAQGMLNTTMLQLNKVELQIAQLNGYLNEHRCLEEALQWDEKDDKGARLLFAGDAEALVAAAAALQAISNATQAIAAGGGAAAGVEGEAAAAPAGGEQADQQRAATRRRLAACVKVALVMILLEVKLGWYFIYFFAAFFYIGGMFDTWIEYFQNFNNNQTTLENQLNALRRGQAPGGEDGADRAAAPEAAGVGAAAPNPAPEVVAAASEGEAVPSSSTEQIAGAAGSGMPTEAVAASGEPAGAAEAAQAAPQPPYWQRFFYQLFVMFFMTLIPWWNPDPRYI
eukprot:TRINITY_DN50311_c0_g1_i1.p1 TRINITY_DN50311_c0_g1~~TRINITY_DN50311_c0_g1_i1.p1  ORF type:complete len:342 (+),score=104.10 TRINITY_DN50311_c0_g1_i1:90-1028(+)